MSIKENLTGQKFGLLTVIEESEKATDGRIQWLCQCDCGNKKNVRSKHLKNGQIVSCGCYFKNNVRTFNKKSYDTKSKEYQLWNKTSGSRCDDWKDFLVFLDWLTKNEYSDHSLYRKDNNAEYSPDNCFLESKENTGKGVLNGNSILYEIDNTYDSIRGWSYKHNINPKIVYCRISRNQTLPIEIALLPSEQYIDAKRKFKQQKYKKTEYRAFDKKSFVYEKNVSGVYCIENIDTNKKYIGSSINIGSRWKQHVNDLLRNSHYSVYLQNSWNKHGGGSFKFYIIEECDISILREREQYYIDKYESFKAYFGFNMKQYV